MKSKTQGTSVSHSSGSTSSAGVTIGEADSLSSLANIQSQLESQRDELAKEAEIRRTQLSSLENDLQRIDSALAALSGKQPPLSPKGQGAGTPPLKKERKAANPAISKSEVIELIKKQLSGSEPLLVEELRSLIEAKLPELGFSRLGFALRFNEALNDSALTVTDGQVTKVGG